MDECKRFRQKIRKIADGFEIPNSRKSWESVQEDLYIENNKSGPVLIESYPL